MEQWVGMRGMQGIRLENWELGRKWRECVNKFGNQKNVGNQGENGGNHERNCSFFDNFPTFLIL